MLHLYLVQADAADGETNLDWFVLANSPEQAHDLWKAHADDFNEESNEFTRIRQIMSFEITLADAKLCRNYPQVLDWEKFPIVLGAGA